MLRAASAIASLLLLTAFLPGPAAALFCASPYVCVTYEDKPAVCVGTNALDTVVVCGGDPHCFLYQDGLTDPPSEHDIGRPCCVVSDNGIPLVQVRQDPYDTGQHVIVHCWGHFIDVCLPLTTSLWTCDDGCPYVNWNSVRATPTDCLYVEA